MSQFPLPSPLPSPTGPATTGSGGGGFAFNFSNLNPYLDSLLGRWGQVMDIQTERLRAQPQRDEIAFNEWLKKREFDRDLAQSQNDQDLARDRETANTSAFNRAQIQQQRMDAEKRCQAARQQGIPCASPGSGSTYGGSSQGGVPSAGLDSSAPVNQVATPAFGPRGSSGGGQTVNVSASGGGGGYVTPGGGGYFSATGAANPAAGFSLPDYWNTDAGADDDERRDRR